MIDYVQEEDYFKLQQVSEQNFADLNVVKTYTKILHHFIRITRENDIRFPPVKAVRVLTQSVIALIIEVTALTRESYSESFEDIYALVKNMMPKKQKQKVMIEQYMIELLHKLLLFFWRNYFRLVYARVSS